MYKDFEMAVFIFLLIFPFFFLKKAEYGTEEWIQLAALVAYYGVVYCIVIYLLPVFG